MAYLDGEIVHYYNKGGSLDSMVGEKTGRIYKYVDRLGYDEFEQEFTCGMAMERRIFMPMTTAPPPEQS